jgi:hypothetical protein
MGIAGYVSACSEAESFKHMKIKYPTLEDGHVGRNKTVKTNTIKLHADGHITCNTN